MNTLTFHPMSTRTNAIHSFFAYDPYIEKFWLPIIGPTATWLINDLVLRALIEKQTFRIDATALSARIGTGSREGNSSPVCKQLARLCQAGIFSEYSSHEYLVPRTINPLSYYLARKLSDAQQKEHIQWLDRLHLSPVATQRRRLGSLVTRLEIMGIDNKVIRSVLLESGLHPSIIGEALSHVSKRNTAA